MAYRSSSVAAIRTTMPLVFVCYDDTKALGADYYRAIASLFYSLDV